MYGNTSIPERVCSWLADAYRVHSCTTPARAQLIQALGRVRALDLLCTPESSGSGGRHAEHQRDAADPCPHLAQLHLRGDPSLLSRVAPGAGERLHTLSLSWSLPGRDASCPLERWQVPARLHTLSLALAPPFGDSLTAGTLARLTAGLSAFSLSGVRLTDVVALGHLHTLTLSTCDHLSDVRALSSVHTLTLANARDLFDVSALGTVHTLTLRCVWAIRDLSQLGGLHTLTLDTLTQVAEVSALGGVHTLTLRELRDRVDVSYLYGVHTLSVIDCTTTDLSVLHRLHSLHLQRCLGWDREVYDLSGLSHLHSLSLARLHWTRKITGWTHLCGSDGGGLRVLRVYDCVAIPTRETIPLQLREALTAVEYHPPLRRAAF
jgi:hypothetical protein